MSWVDWLRQIRSKTAASGNALQTLDTPESMQELALRLLSNDGPGKQFNDALQALHRIADANKLPKDHPFRLLFDEWGNGLGTEFISKPIIHVPAINNGQVNNVLTTILNVNRRPSQRQVQQKISHDETRWEAMTGLVDALKRDASPINESTQAQWNEARGKMATAWNEIATFIQRAETYMAQRGYDGFGSPG